MNLSIIKRFFNYTISQNFQHAFDDLKNLNVHVIDQMLNLYGLQLKFLSPRHTDWKRLLDKMIGLYEDAKYLGLIWNKRHYQVLAKWDSFFYIYDSCYDYPIRCTYRELLEYISEEDVRFFFIHDTIDEEYHLDFYLKENIYGGGRRGKQEMKDLRNGPGKSQKIAGRRRRRNNIQENSDDNQVKNVLKSGCQMYIEKRSKRRRIPKKGFKMDYEFLEESEGDIQVCLKHV